MGGFQGLHSFRQRLGIHFRLIREFFKVVVPQFTVGGRISYWPEYSTDANTLGGPVKALK